METKSVHANLLQGYQLLGHALASMEKKLQSLGFPLFVLFTLFYYGSYFNAGLTLNGEAGSNVLLAMRIQSGWLPMKDMFMGYNLMWFYPLTWIFNITGPHLLATQIYFMTLSALTGMLGYALVQRATGWAWLALGTAVLMVLMPGAIFRNYMGLIGTLASFVLVRAYVLNAGSTLRQCIWMGLAGSAISLCYLIRIEPSLLLTVVWGGLILLYPWLDFASVFKRIRVVLMGSVFACVAFAAVHVPFVMHADHRGFGKEFRAQYGNFVKLMASELKRETVSQTNLSDITHETPKKLGHAGSISLPSAIEKSAPLLSPQSTPVQEGNGRRGRPSLLDAVSGKSALYFTLSLYFPILSAAVMMFFGGALLVYAFWRQSTSAMQSALLVLTTAGCALSLFPQYYFFRPDSVHLAEFMVPFYPALACTVFVAVAVFSRSNFLRLPMVFIIVICSLQAVVAFNSLFGREGSGSIRQARGRTAYFHAFNGVDFRVPPKDLPHWEGVRDAILSNAKPGEFVVTYPYVAVLNVLTDRPSYQHKLYADNATETAEFSKKAIEDLEKNAPAVVVVNNRDINKTEISRFKNWASPFYEYLKGKYTLEGTYFSQVEVFVRTKQTTPLSN
jgi:hypothetical protein